MSLQRWTHHSFNSFVDHAHPVSWHFRRGQITASSYVGNWGDHLFSLNLILRSVAFTWSLHINAIADNIKMKKIRVTLSVLFFIGINVLRYFIALDTFGDNVLYVFVIVPKGLWYAGEKNKTACDIDWWMFFHAGSWRSILHSSIGIKIPAIFQRHAVLSHRPSGVARVAFSL